MPEALSSAYRILVWVGVLFMMTSLATRLFTLNPSLYCSTVSTVDSIFDNITHILHQRDNT
jgi:hypothetical protein